MVYSVTMEKPKVIKDKVLIRMFMISATETSSPQDIECIRWPTFTTEGKPSAEHAPKDHRLVRLLLEH